MAIDFVRTGKVTRIGKLLEHGNTVLYLQTMAGVKIVRVDVVTLPPLSRARAS